MFFPARIPCFCDSHKASLFPACLILAGIFFSAPALAGIVELQPFSFGSVVVADNSAPQTITVLPAGGFNHSAGLIMITPPTPGRYQIDGLPSNGTILSLTVTEISPLVGGGANNFTLDNFQTICPDPDAAGETILRLGGTANSSGGGAAYADDTYIGEVSVEFNF